MSQAMSSTSMHWSSYWNASRQQAPEDDELYIRLPIDDLRPPSPLEEIRRQITYHEEQAARLKQQMNNLMLISKLPSEVLVEIFFYYALNRFLDRYDNCPLEFHRRSHRYGRESYYPGFSHWDCNLRRVCQRWRQVIKQSSVLGKLIAMVANSSEIENQLNGSRNLRSVALKAIAHFRNLHEYSGSLELIFKELSRAEMVLFEVPRSVYDDYLPEEVTSLPLLTHIRISDKNAIGGECYMPFRYFNSSLKMPKLRILELSFCTLDLVDTIVQPQITSLFLRRIMASSVTIQEILKKLPNLEVLDLDCAFPDVPRTIRGRIEWHVVGKKDVIHLPKLQPLRLRSSPTACANLLQYLDFPISTQVVLEYKLGRLIESPNFIPFITASREKFFSHLEELGVFSEAHCRTISLLRGDADFRPHPMIKVFLWTTVEPHESLPVGTKPPDLTITLQGLDEPMIRSIPYVLPLKHLKSFCIGPILKMNQEAHAYIIAWVKIYRELVDLEQLKVFGMFAWCIPNIFNLIQTHLSCQPAQKLNTLILEDIRFVADFDQGSNSSDGEFDRRLVVFLKGRKEGGMPLDQVIINEPWNFANAEEYVKVLEKYTKNGVVWEKFIPHFNLYIDQKGRADIFSFDTPEIQEWMMVAVLSDDEGEDERGLVEENRVESNAVEDAGDEGIEEGDDGYETDQSVSGSDILVIENQAVGFY
ncbi:hypothetical protein ABKN59_012025 [Abortiporus biennis]